MKSTTVSIALLLFYMLLILPNVYGTRGPVVHPRPLRAQQASGVPPGLIMRQQRAVLQGHFRQPRPLQQEAGRMAASGARYARGLEYIDGAFVFVKDAGSAETTIANNGADGVKNIAKTQNSAVRSIVIILADNGQGATATLGDLHLDHAGSEQSGSKKKK